MEITEQMAKELENMIGRGEIQVDVVDEIQEVIGGLREGKALDEFYRASTPHKVLEIFDVINQRVKR